MKNQLLPLAAVCLLCAGFATANVPETGITITEQAGYAGPIGTIGLKVLEAAGANVELMQADLPRTQRIQHAANAAAETFAKSMQEPLPKASVELAGLCRDGSCKIERKVERTQEAGCGEAKATVHKERHVSRERNRVRLLGHGCLFGRCH